MTTWEERFSPTPRHEPRLERLKTVWRMRGRTSGLVTECAVYLTDIGFEVRVGRSERDLRYSQRFTTPADAYAHAELLRTDMLAGGKVDELSAANAP
jgi:hypothetical protein